MQGLPACPHDDPMTPPAPSPTSVWGALRHPAFRGLWQSGAVYFIGNAMQTMAAAWMKLAERAATTRSQPSATLAPAPAATPLTAAITGTGIARKRNTSGL